MGIQTRVLRSAVALVVTAALAGSAAAACAPAKTAAKVVDLLGEGHARELRKRREGAPAHSPGRPTLLILALDGVDRTTLYDRLDRGEMPSLAELLGGRTSAGFAHAYRHEHLLATMPSSTMAAWTTAMTGVPPGEHGITGNEFFIRASSRLGAPAPVSFSDSGPTIAIYTDGYLDSLKKAPSVYEQMRERDPDVLVWVAMHQIYSGADRLLVTKRSIMADAFEHVILKATAPQSKATSRHAYAKLDENVIENVVEELATGEVPDVLTVYLSGTDLYAHIAAEGPDKARQAYLREVVDPALAKLLARLRERKMLEDRFVVVTSDHGHTEILEDAEHALSSEDDSRPTMLLKRAGYRPRPLKTEVAEDDDFDAVYTGGGATAFFYVADRSSCSKPKTRCDWGRPPRYEEDVLPLADALFRNDRDGGLVPAMRGAIDLVLTRRPKPPEATTLPFEVYVGDGRTQPVDAFLAAHPRPTYIELASRLHDLAVGPNGDRAGDVMVIAHNGDRDDPSQRYYFAAPYHSWHGSPSRGDSEIPLIVAHAGVSGEALRARVDKVVGTEPRQQKLTPLLLDLRYGVAR